MRIQRVSIFGFIAIVFIVVGMYTSFWLTESEYKNPKNEIFLPKDVDTSSHLQTGQSQIVDLFNEIPFEVNVSNVKNIIETLERPSNYTVDVTSTYFWDDSSGQITSKYYRNLYFTKIEKLDGNGEVEEHFLLSQTHLYSWIDGHTEYFIGPVTSENGLLYIPTYKDILQIDQNEISSAQMVYNNGTPNIEVSVTRENTVQNYTISIETGLLIYYERYVDDILTNTSLIDNIEDAADNIFLLPDGQTPE